MKIFEDHSIPRGKTNKHILLIQGMYQDEDIKGRGDSQRVCHRPETKTNKQKKISPANMEHSQTLSIKRWDATIKKSESDY